MKAYIVLPPGHGKTVMHDPEQGLFEADQLVDYKTVDKLSRLRAAARRSGDWKEFDRCWGELLERALPEGGIVMVPHGQVGRGTGMRSLGGCYLPVEKWEVNFENRKGNPDKYGSCHEDATLCGTQVGNNQETTEWVHNQLEQWRRKLGTTSR